MEREKKRLNCTFECSGGRAVTGLYQDKKELVSTVLVLMKTKQNPNQLKNPNKTTNLILSGNTTEFGMCTSNTLLT